MKLRKGIQGCPSWLVALATLMGVALHGRTTAALVNIGSQLMVTDLKVVEDPLRTAASNPNAPWTFGYLMSQMAGDQDPSDFVLQWLQTWETDQFINGNKAAARSRIRDLVINPWLLASGGQRLDLTKAPFKLLAIVNRMDLRRHDDSVVETAGEGRFVFGLVNQDGTPVPPIAGVANNPGGFILIMEYELCATNKVQLQNWIQRWSMLGKFPVGSPQYNAQLEAVTRAFSDKGRAPHKPNGNPINQVRSNELSLAEPWELREFTIQGGSLRPHGMAQSPDFISLNGTPAFANLINANATALLNGTYVLPATLQAASSLAGPFLTTDFVDFSSRSFTVIGTGAKKNIPWSAAGIQNNDARQAFALNTCGGCHRAETAINFIHVGFPVGNSLPTRLGKPAALSGFLTGKSIADPVVGSTTRVFGDLQRRQQDFSDLIDNGARGRHWPTFVH